MGQVLLVLTLEFREENRETPYLLFQSGQRQHRGEVPVVGADDPAGELRRQ
jgi:hypothetical protein